MKKLWPRVIVALLILQGTLIAAYFVLESPEEPDRTEVNYVTTQWIESMDEPIEPFEVERAGGVRERVEPGPGVLVHFWATWCPSCVDELPQLLQEARERDIRVVAISLDDDWEILDNFFDGDIPSEVVRPSDVRLARKLGVVDLPQTIVVKAQARRYVGPRDWSVTLPKLGFE